ncbi:hypothetical protein BC939DRAFT_457638 [Gamsiella multidivaricata]|uniref:uncharacterized protein n=1 Tax=Gamsiella multidivaricata TaxID=101098 RepID=UPI00221EC656|nr:uncharacterized protein BC939DRAFT_457638 [Gamsiella multidivaricata]KAI7820546.1 hypothetical protein BC939DRAFT_457638 [Gamsiella multidivaricata]
MHNMNPLLFVSSLKARMDAAIQCTYPSSLALTVSHKLETASQLVMAARLVMPSVYRQTQESKRTKLSQYERGSTTRRKRWAAMCCEVDDE